MLLENKLKNIFNQLYFLRSQFETTINVNKINDLPSQINAMVIGTNKLPLFISGQGNLIITEQDLNQAEIIYKNAFEYCTNLTNITIPDSVTTISDYAFNNCTSLTEVTIPDSVTTIGDYAFEYCDNLIEITIPDSVTVIGKSAFYRCDSLTSVTIGNSVTTISENTFYDCTGLTEITIPDSVTVIGKNAFNNCSSLTEVTIPDSVTVISENAFNGCNSLRHIYLQPTTPPILGSTSAIPRTTTIHVPVGSGEAYKTATNWSRHADKIIEDPEL